MLASAIDGFTNIVNSPPAQLVAGGVLAGIVWKFFERVESILRESTKVEIAVWLVGVDIGRGVEQWSGHFAKVFDKFFGPRALSWKTFKRSCVVTYVITICLIPVALYLQFAQSVARGMGVSGQLPD